MTHPASRRGPDLAPAVLGSAVERGPAHARTLGLGSHVLLSPEANGTRAASTGAVAGRNPPATNRGDHVGPPGVVAADTRLCRKCGVPLEAGTYLRLRHAVRRPRGAVNHYPR